MTLHRILLIQGDARKIALPDESVQCVVTSPPYFGLRDYGTGGQIGLENSLAEYLESMCLVFDEVWRVLRPDGTVWLNMGDSYAGSGGAGGDYNEGGLKEGQPRYEGTGRQMRESNRRDRAEVIPGRTKKHSGFKPKDLMGVPWRLAFALQERGWWLRSDIIWHKPNSMPESVTDRPTRSHEYIFLLSKSKTYFYDADAIREEKTESTIARQEYPRYADGSKGDTGNYAVVNKEYNKISNGRNKRTVWTVTTKAYKGSHYATFPPDLIEPCILAGTSEKGQCPECGAPWERVVEKVGAVKNFLFSKSKYSEVQQGGIESTTLNATPAQSITTGWRPTCSHDLDPVPQIVLDPFGGSGVTAMVANQHGRIGISNELSIEYVYQAQKRTGLKELREWTQGKQATKPNITDLPLFSYDGETTA